MVCDNPAEKERWGAHLNAPHPKPVEAHHIFAGLEPKMIQEARENGQVQLLHTTIARAALDSRDSWSVAVRSLC